MSSNGSEYLRAGDLTADHIGKTIRVAVSLHVKVEDEVETVGHVMLADGVRTTLIVFKDTTPENMGNGTLEGLIAQLHTKRGFLVPATDFVMVVTS